MPPSAFEVRLMFKRTDSFFYAALVTIPLVPDSNGTAIINWQTVLHAALEYDLPGETIYATRMQTGQFYIQYRELSKTMTQAGWDDSEAEFAKYVVKGGVPEFSFNNNAYWVSFFKQQKPFFTWQVKRRLASFTERMHLAWLHPADVSATNLKLFITVYFNDLTNTTKSVAFNTTPMEVVYLPAGADMLDLDELDPTKKIWYWTMQVQGQDSEPLSEIFKYELDNRPVSNDITLVYRGSTGGLDTIRIRGVVEQDPDYITQEVSRQRKPHFLENVSATRRQLPASEVVTYKGDVGHLAKEEQDRLRDLYLQREVYQVINSKLVPVNFTMKGFKLRATTDKRWSLPIEFSLAHEGDAYYAPRSVDFGAGFTGETVCLSLVNVLSPTITFNAGNTVATAAWQFSVSVAPLKVQYKIVGTTDWIDTPYPYTSPLQTTHGVNQPVTVQFRAFCDNGIPGPISTIQFDTTVAATGGGGTGGGGGTTNNSRITSHAVGAVGYIIRVNGVYQTSNTLNPGASDLFDTADLLAATVEIIFNSYVPVDVQLDSGGNNYSTVPSSIPTGSIATFYDVDITNGIQIVFW
jgi:hypothetical protein